MTEKEKLQRLLKNQRGVLNYTKIAKLAELDNKFAVADLANKGVVKDEYLTKIKETLIPLMVDLSEYFSE